MAATERQLTDEQRQIIEHDPAAHATVLAVAGAGKTTTMVYRIRHLIERAKVPPIGIRAVMFNRSARIDFQAKMRSVAERENAPCLKDVGVQTFHSLGNDIIHWCVRKELFQERTLLSDEDGRLLAFTREAVDLTVRENSLTLPSPIDPDDVLDAIHTWKAMMTPPEHARHVHFPAYPLVYRTFERERIQQNLLTYDDMIFEAVRLLEEQTSRGEHARKTLVNRLDHIIVDEFQDVNYARQQLIWLLAGTLAKVMVVGDDDQCVYEWLGARAVYLTRVFREKFNAHPHAVYHLSRSFRFGPVIAQSAANVIAQNTDRARKTLVAGDLCQKGGVHVCIDRDGTQGGQPARQIETLLGEGIQPKNIVVLVRSYAQACETQAGLLARRIPYFVENERPFIQRHPVAVALDYLHLVNGVGDALSPETAGALTQCIHRPWRYVKRREFADATDRAMHDGLRLNAFLDDEARLGAVGIQGRPLRAVAEFCDLLEEAARVPAAHQALGLLCDRINFTEYFSSFQSPDRTLSSMAVLDSFVTLLREAQVPLAGIDTFLSDLDSTRGCKEVDCVRITSLFKAKGLEWDYVLMPEVMEGQLPDLRASESFAEDIEHPERSLDRTECVESERRLFYVAVTRAMTGCFIYTQDTERRKVSRFIHEALTEPTAQAIIALQGVIETGCLTPEGAGRLRNGAGQAFLRSGLMEMLASAMRTRPEFGSVLSEALAQVAAVQPRAFQYPASFPPDSPASRQPGNLGLPF